MMKNLFLTVLVILEMSIWAQAQNSHKAIAYSVDSLLANPLKNFHSNDSGMMKKSMQLKVYMDGRSFFDQSSGPLDVYAKSYISGDSIFITGHMEGEIGYGFLLVLFGDSCIVSGFAYSDAPIYRYRATDTSFVDFITPGNKTQKVTITKKPFFEEGDIITGLVELESKAFFYYQKKANRFTIKLKVYFKTMALQQEKNELENYNILLL